MATVGRVTEITSSSKISFDRAITKGVERACKTLDNVTGAWVQDQKVIIKKGNIEKYQVNLKITFILKD